jgi:hypothetical protein
MGRCLIRRDDLQKLLVAQSVKPPHLHLALDVHIDLHSLSLVEATGFSVANL